MALIAVVGATGLQGGAVARSLAASGKFTIRGITRKPDADPAKKLVSDIGCEIVKADLDDKASLVKAFEGCHGAFLITNFWEHLDTEKEIAQAKNLGDAAKEAGVKHCVFSSLEHCNKIWKTETKPIGKYLVPHFDGKGIAMEYFKEIGLPCTEFLTSFYYENFINFGMGPKAQGDGPKSITFPIADSKMCINAVEDIGKFGAKIFEDESLIGKQVGVQSCALTGNEIAAVFEDVLGEKVVYNSVPRDVYAGFGFPGADDLANMFQFFHEDAKGFDERRSVENVKKLIGKTVELKDWVAANKAAFK